MREREREREGEGGKYVCWCMPTYSHLRPNIEVNGPDV